MKYLIQLLNALQEQHWQQLEGMQQSATEKQLLAYIKRHYNTTIGSNKEVAVELGFTEAYLRKLLSGLLSRILFELSGDSVEERIVLLGRLRLHKLLKHEIKRKEKELIAANNTAQLSLLYQHAIEPFLHAVATDIDDSFIQQLIDSYRGLRGYQEATALMLELQRLSTVSFVASVKHTAGSKALKDAALYVHGELKRIEGSEALRTDVVATYWLHKTWKYYHELLAPDQEVELEQLQILSSIVDKHPEQFKPQFRVYPAAEIAEICIDRSEYQQAYDRFEKVFADEPELMLRWINYIDKYAQVCIVLGKYDQAKDLIIKGYRLQPENPWESKSAMYVQHLYLAIAKLMTDDNSTAYKHLQVAKEMSAKSEFFWVEVLLRAIEQAYFFLVGEYQMTENLFQKNIRFLNYYPNDDQLQQFKYFHQFIIACLQMKEEQKPFTQQQLQQFHALQQGHLAFLGVLLKKIRSVVDKTYDKH